MMRRHARCYCVLMVLAVAMVVVSAYMLMRCERKILAFNADRTQRERASGAIYPIPLSTPNGQSSNNAEEAQFRVPRVIWSYWHSDDLPPLISHNLKRWRAKLPQFSIRFLSESTLSKYLPSLRDLVPAGYDKLSKAHQADWIRLFLLKEYGGIWADASILFNSEQALEEMRLAAEQQRVDLAGFHIDKLRTVKHHNNFPIIENWLLIAADKQSIIAHRPYSLMQMWFDEYSQAISTGFTGYRRYAEQDLRVDSQQLFDNPTDTYLTCHLCMQAILQRHLTLNRLPYPRLLLQRAENSMFLIQDAMHWVKWHVGKALLTQRALQLPYIKLRGTDRSCVTEEKLIAHYTLRDL